jgi:hypothetical protein
VYHLCLHLTGHTTPYGLRCVCLWGSPRQSTTKGTMRDPRRRGHQCAASCVVASQRSCSCLVAQQPPASFWHQVRVSSASITDKLLNPSRSTSRSRNHGRQSGCMPAGCTTFSACLT